MPSSRRLPPADQPSRRPRVAGLRRPAGQSGQTGESGQSGQTDQPGSAGRPAHAEPEPPETAAETTTEITREAPAETTPGERAPRRKRRDRGTARPSDEAQVLTEPESAVVATEYGDGETESAARPGGRAKKRKSGRSRRSAAPGKGRYVLVAVLLVAALAFSGLAVLFKIRQSEATAATSNMALVDVAATAQVKDAMTSAAERLFSLDYNNLGKTEKAADELLVNKEVRRTYDQLMRDVKSRAPQQKIVVTVHATRSAVVRLEDDRAKVMVYVDQTATRASDNKSSSASAALWFNTERRDGQWKITGMDSYSAAAQPTMAPKPQQSQQPQQPQQPQGN